MSYNTCYGTAKKGYVNWVWDQTNAANATIIPNEKLFKLNKNKMKMSQTKHIIGITSNWISKK